MRVLFWNMGRRPLVPLLNQLVRKRDVDLLVLAEAPATSAVMKELNAGSEQLYLPPKGIESRARVLSRLPVDAVTPVSDSRYISARHVVPPLGWSFLLIAVHLSSKLRQDSREQAVECGRLRVAVEEAEQAVGHRRTLIVGDFNMNPFEDAVVAAEGLQAVSSRSVATQQGRSVRGEHRHFFYNPMWNHFGDRGPSPPGTYYYRGGQISFFWNIFDQVMIRPELMPAFNDDSLEIISSINGQTLLRASGRPNGDFGSDHLPLLFELAIERKTEHASEEHMEGR